MSDHKMIHRRLSIENLVSIDGDEEVVRRQNFNKPTEKCICLHTFSGDFIDELDASLKRNGIDENSRKVIWLDYTEPNNLDDQLDEFESLLNKVAENDIVRITLNANNEALKFTTSKDMDAEKIRSARFEALKSMVGNYLPNGSSDKDLSSTKFPELLAKILGRSAEEAFPPRDTYTFLPISTVSYRDGQRMLTMTGIVLKRTRIRAFLDETGFRHWPFFSNGFDDVNSLNVAVLTMKERMLMERLAVSSKSEDVVAELGFEKFGKLKACEYFEDFKKHAKFYPTHAQLDL